MLHLVDDEQRHLALAVDEVPGEVPLGPQPVSVGFPVCRLDAHDGVRVARERLLHGRRLARLARAEDDLDEVPTLVYSVLDCLDISALIRHYAIPISRKMGDISQTLGSPLHFGKMI